MHKDVDTFTEVKDLRTENEAQIWTKNDIAHNKAGLLVNLVFLQSSLFQNLTPSSFNAQNA